MATCQLPTDVEDPQRSTALTRAAISEAIAGGAQTVVVPDPILYADCKLSEARDKRLSAHNDIFADRRADRYARTLLEG